MLFIPPLHYEIINIPLAREALKRFAPVPGIDKEHRHPLQEGTAGAVRGAQKLFRAGVAAVKEEVQLGAPLRAWKA